MSEMISYIDELISTFSLGEKAPEEKPRRGGRKAATPTTSDWVNAVNRAALISALHVIRRDMELESRYGHTCMRSGTSGYFTIDRIISHIHLPSDELVFAEGWSHIPSGLVKSLAPLMYTSMLSESAKVKILLRALDLASVDRPEFPIEVFFSDEEENQTLRDLIFTILIESGCCLDTANSSRDGMFVAGNRGRTVHRVLSYAHERVRNQQLPVGWTRTDVLRYRCILDLTKAFAHDVEKIDAISAPTAGVATVLWYVLTVLIQRTLGYGNSDAQKKMLDHQKSYSLALLQVFADHKEFYKYLSVAYYADMAVRVPAEPVVEAE